MIRHILSYGIPYKCFLKEIYTCIMNGKIRHCSIRTV